MDFTNLQDHIEEVLEQNWYTAYTHSDEWDTVFWSKSDLLATDGWKKWFLY